MPLNLNGVTFLISNVFDLFYHVHSVINRVTDVRCL